MVKGGPAGPGGQIRQLVGDATLPQRLRRGVSEGRGFGQVTLT